MEVDSVEKLAQDILDCAGNLAEISNTINTQARFIHAIQEEPENYRMVVIQGQDVAKALREIAFHMDREAYGKWMERQVDNS